MSFLSSELCVLCPEEAAEHIFFVSARETLDQCDIANVSPGRSPRDGWQARVQEFANFERKFEVKHIPQFLSMSFVSASVSCQFHRSGLKNAALQQSSHFSRSCCLWC